MNEKFEAIRLAAHAELQRHPKVRPWWVDALVLLGVNVLFGVGTALALSLPRVGIGSLGWLGALAFCVLGVVGSIAAVRPGWRQVRVALVALAGLSMLLVLLGASGFDPGRPFLGGSGCGLIEGLASIVPVAVSLLVLSRFAPDPLRAVVGGLAAGVGGLLALHLHCPDGTLGHLLAFHLGPWLLVSLGAVGLRRLLGSATWAP